MNFVSCIKWVKQGTAKPEPDKVNLSAAELAELLNEKNAVDDTDVKRRSNKEDEFNFEQYDEEDDTLKASLKDIAVYDELNNDSKTDKNRKNDDDSDSEREDELIKADDNLILVGHIDDDQSSLEIYVYNDYDGDMYIHHDIMLSSMPLCVEPLYQESKSAGNLCVVGGMSPVIDVWDLDIIGCVEPVIQLGKRKKKSTKKNGEESNGHTDAVLDIAWNLNLTHILASGSVDQTVLLWDLDVGCVATTIDKFSEKVQNIMWNPFCSNYLLTASADKKVRNFDCRVYDQYQTWKLESEVEKITWSSKNSNVCYAGTEQGYIYTIDTRQVKKPIYQFSAHDKEVTGLIYTNFRSELLLTCSMDETFKSWDISESKERLICSQNMRLDSLQCLDTNPDLPYLACVGGTSLRKNKNIKVINMNQLIKHKKTHQPFVDAGVALLEV